MENTIEGGVVDVKTGSELHDRAGKKERCELTKGRTAYCIDAGRTRHRPTPKNLVKRWHTSGNDEGIRQSSDGGGRDISGGHEFSSIALVPRMIGRLAADGVALRPRGTALTRLGREADERETYLFCHASVCRLLLST